MKACPDIWNLLHDATIVDVAGRVPGTVTLHIECDYLRQRFPEPGTRFVLTLNGCTRFVFRSWSDDANPISALDAIARLSVDVLSADQMNGYCRVHCNLREAVGGDLLVAAQEAELRLDSGRFVSYEDLDAVSDAYWEEWSRGKKR